MFDEMDRLRDVKELQALLIHYRDQGLTDRTVWQDRICAQDGVDPRELVRLHGELIAYGWIEQNTGIVAEAKRGAAPSCYRITPAGIRALKQLVSEEVECLETEAPARRLNLRFPDPWSLHAAMVESTGTTVPG